MKSFKELTEGKPQENLSRLFKKFESEKEKFLSLGDDLLDSLEKVGKFNLDMKKKVPKGNKAFDKMEEAIENFVKSIE